MLELPTKYDVMVCAMDDMGWYTNYFGALGDINVRYIDWIMSNLRPDIEMKNYYIILCNLYAELDANKYCYSNADERGLDILRERS